MLKLYLKQALSLLRQNRLFSLIYIVGTAFAIAMTMMMAVIYYVRLAPLYPEYGRGRTLYLSHVKYNLEQPQGRWGWWTGGFSYSALQNWLYQMPFAKVISARSQAGLGVSYVSMPQGGEDEEVVTVLTDPAFFRLYTFRFTDGAPFTQADLDGGIGRVVITDRLARRLYGADRGVVGRPLRLNLKEYTVCGVVRAASRLMEGAAGDVYLPYSVLPGYDEVLNPELPDYGSFSVTFLAKDRASMDSIRRSVDDYVRRWNLSHEQEYYSMTLEGGLVSHTQQVFQRTADSEGDTLGAVKHLALIVLVLLLVPSLNLSGLISSRMEARLPEMGVRKTFGAWRRTLLSMVLWENLLLTLIGGVIGLILAFLCLYVGRGWVFTLLDSYAMQLSGADTVVSGEMLFAPVVFVLALLLCLLLNILSALIPAWWSLRHPIVQSLYEKRT